MKWTSTKDAFPPVGEECLGLAPYSGAEVCFATYYSDGSSGAAWLISGRMRNSYETRNPDDIEFWTPISDPKQPKQPDEESDLLRMYEVSNETLNALVKSQQALLDAREAQVAGLERQIGTYTELMDRATQLLDPKHACVHCGSTRELNHSGWCSECFAQGTAP